MIRWLLIASILIALLVGIALCSGKTYRSMSYTYPVNVQLPADTQPRVVSYLCFFNREQAEFVLDDFAEYSDTFETVPSTHFDAIVRGHWTTSWCGLFSNKGRESFLVVLVESQAGETLVGMTELPDEEAPVVVTVGEAP